MKHISGILKHIPFIIWSAIVLVPLTMLLFISLKSAKEYGATFPVAPPVNLFFENYSRVLIEGRILSSLKNSVILVIAGSCGSALLGAMAAYCLDRFDFFLKKYILGFYVSSVIIPGALLQIFLYKVLRTVHLTGTFGAPILIYISTDIITVWIYLQFFRNISKSLDESAMIDGASYFKIFRSILFPLLLPATATVMIIRSIYIYGDMFTQYLFMSSAKLQTVTMSLMAFSGQFATTFNVMAAGCIAVMLPTMLIFLILQKRIISGVTVGSVKG